jgi:homoserine O-acetyltransferase
MAAWMPFTAAAQPTEPEPSYFLVKDFRLQSGEVIDEMIVEYGTIGTPRTDADGNITNAVVMPHGWSGDYKQYLLFKGLIGPGLPLDTDRYYVITPTALGSPGSSSPSVSGLGPEFPKYTVVDMITAQHRLVTEHLKIEHLAGVVGASMGGMQTLVWITRYPDFMDWAIAMATGPAIIGRNAGIFGLMNHVIQTDPNYMGGNYREQPRVGMEKAFMGVYLWYFTAAYFQQKYDTNDALMQGLKDIGIGSSKMDANDIIWRNDAMTTYDVRRDLAQVKARTLVIGVDSDELFTPDEDVLPIVRGIPGAKRFTYDSIAGHIGIAIDIRKASTAITQFLAAEK